MQPSRAQAPSSSSPLGVSHFAYLPLVPGFPPAAGFFFVPGFFLAAIVAHLLLSALSDPALLLRYRPLGAGLLSFCTAGASTAGGSAPAHATHSFSSTARSASPRLSPSRSPQTNQAHFRHDFFLLFMDSDFSDFVYPRAESCAGAKNARLSGLSSVSPLCRQKEVNERKQDDLLTV